ncbi:MAG: cytochrome c [Phaeodactylibacter sp.]|nr:cytochrome c [Phaeodactylibacter sp.]MCB9050867.1 cytochrome c [Lewinellaceae bacterium]
MKQHRVLSILAFAALLLSALGPSACTSEAGILVIEPPDIDTTVQVSFAEEIIPLFNQSCNFSGCHNTGGAAPDLTPANAYEALINGSYINTETPGDSELMQWLLGNGGRQVMPINGKDDEIVSKVLTWITQGAKDN